MTSRASLPPLTPAIRGLTDTESAALDVRVPMAFDADRHCVTCRGRGWFRWRDQAGVEVDYDCPCPRQYRLHRYLLHSGVLLNYQRLGWADFTYPAEEVKDAAAEYLVNSRAFVDAGFGLVIHGPRGNGKSLLGYLIVKYLISEGVDCFATTFAEMVDHFASGWRDPVQERWFNNTVRNAGVLMIDDLGREYKRNRFGEVALSPEQVAARAATDNRPGSVTETMLESVIRHRTGSLKPTIITTNYSEEEVRTGYGGHTFSLLSEKAVFLGVAGTDRREDIATREKGLILRGLTRPVVVS